MKWISSIIPFKILFFSASVLLYLSGCAGSTPDEETEKASSSNQKGNSNGPQPSNPTPESTTKMKVQYANRSSKVSIDIDVNNQDINLDMSGSSMAPPAPATPLAEGENKTENPQENSNGSPSKKDSPKGKSEDDWDEVMDIAKNKDFAGNTNQSVLAEIRKAQEFFYQKRYPEALDMAKFSIQKQETAEGHALKGSIEYIMGDIKAAKESWNQSLRLNPDMPAVTQMLRKLKDNEEKKKMKVKGIPQ